MPENHYWALSNIFHICSQYSPLKKEDVVPLCYELTSNPGYQNAFYH